MGIGSPTFFELFFSFEGRINLAKFWLYDVLVLNAVFVAFVIAGAAVGDAGIVIGYILGVLVVFWPSLALNVKRCHDLDRSGFFVLVGLVPLLNLWYLIEVLLLPGDSYDNQYGPDPLRKQDPS